MNEKTVFLEWNDTFKIGVDTFDNHHKRLVDILNRLDSSLHDDNRRHVLGELLRELIDYTFYHFNAEEKYMLSIDYPEFKEHRRLHKKLIDTLQYNVDLFLKKKPIEISLMSFLYKWLTTHIANEDRKYAEFALKNNKPIPIV